MKFFDEDGQRWFYFGEVRKPRKDEHFLWGSASVPSKASTDFLVIASPIVYKKAPLVVPRMVDKAWTDEENDTIMLGVFAESVCIDKTPKP